MSVSFLSRRRTLAALAAAGLPVAALAHADPPALPAPDADVPAAAQSLPAPAALGEAFERAARPLPAPSRDWTELAPPAAERDDRDVDADEEPRSRGWLSFAPARVRPASNLRPVPDPYAGGSQDDVYRGGDAYGTPAPAPLPTFDDLPADPALPPPSYDGQNYGGPGLGAPGAGFTPVPRSSNYGPPAEYSPPLRDLRTPEPPPYAPLPPREPVYHEPVYGAPFVPPPSFGTPRGEFYHGPPAVGGIGAGFGAGPIADLASAGGMCDLDACDGGVPLFRAVRIEDRRNIAPHAIRKVIAVADPRLPAPPFGLAKLFHRECRGCAAGCNECAPCDDGPALVFVEVCVPPCRAEEVKITRSGHRVHLDYGKYEVTLTSRDGCVKVDYDD